jgi:hypothetical protein
MAVSLYGRERRNKPVALLLTYQEILKAEKSPAQRDPNLTQQHFSRNTNRLLPINKRIELLALPALVAAALATIASTSPEANLRAFQVVIPIGWPIGTLVDGSALGAVGAEETAGVVAGRDV